MALFAPCIPYIAGAAFLPSNGGYIFISLIHSDKLPVRKEAILGRAAEQQSKYACRSDTMPSYARGFCRVGLQAVWRFPFGQ